MKTRLLNLLLLLFSATVIQAQGQPSFPEQIAAGFNNQFDKSPQEKVYLHTDKSSYTAGESIWFRAYCTDATYHVPGLLSRFVYVELINRRDSVIKRVKLRQTDSCFYGNIRLSPDVPSGDYMLCAYTNWMRNFGEDFFFRKNIRIVNTGDKVHHHAITTRNGETVTTTITLVANDGTPYKDERVRTNLRHGKQNVRTITLRTDGQGRITIDHPAADSADNIRLSFPNNQPESFSACISLPDLSGDFDLQFFPEGGNLTTGISQLTAFRATDANGLSAEAEGRICNSRGETVATFKASHRGMGTFRFTPQPNEQYHAIASIPGCPEKNIPLPLPQASALTLSLTQGKSVCRISVNKGSASNSPRPLHIIAHTRGMLLVVIPANDSFIGEIPLGSIPPGITHFLLTDDSGRIYSQRLCFIPPRPDSQITLKNDKSRYDRREKVTLHFSLSDSIRASGQSRLSVAVTDNSQVVRDTLADNIITHLLLSSDLKGRIEAPGSYAHETTEHLDLLMLTHGWTRFDVNRLSQAISPQFSHKLELDQELSGQITNYGNKAMENSTLQVFVPSLQLLGSLQASPNGTFRIKDIAFPDSTLFLLRGFKAKGGKFVEIHMDEQTYPANHASFPETFRSKPATADEFTDRFKGNYYIENGVKVYLLEEAVVRRNRIRKPLREYAGEYTDMADQILGQEEISKYSATSIFHLLMRLPGVYVTGENVSIRQQGTPLFLVDGTPMESESINSIMPEDVDNVGVIKDGARLAFFGSQGGNGVIIINTKHGQVNVRPTPGMLRFTPFGYLRPDEFYMPRYETAEELNSPEIDYRSTIYWNPNIVTDSTGQAEVTFYTADPPTTYTITAEGMSSSGIIFRQTGTILRK